MTTIAQRSVQRIHGRDYRVEVTQVAFERWRAHVINAHGGPTALMPFYAITADLAAATQPGQLLPRPYALDNEVFIAQVVERQLPDPEELSKKKEEIRQQLAGQKEQKLVDAFTKQLRAGAEVVKNPMIASGTEAPAEAG